MGGEDGMLIVGGEEYLDSEEAARLLGVKRQTLYAYVSRGVLRSYRQGIKRQRLYPRGDPDAPLRLGPTPAGPAAGPPAERLSARRTLWEIPLAESWVRD